MNTDVVTHYDLLIDEGNDPVNDPKSLQKYMDKWDGQPFIDALCLDKTKSVLEIGVGTGRLAIRIAPLCKHFTGVDISPKTIEKAYQHLKKNNNVTLICGDYTTHNFDTNYDVIYSSLTWMHIQNKQFAIDKTVDLLNAAGRFVLSISKDQSNAIDFGTRKIAIYPDNPESTETGIKNSGLVIVRKIQTENAYIFISEKR